MSVHDIDAAVAEHAGEPVLLRLCGQQWELPPSRPAAVTILSARWVREGRAGDSLTGAEIVHLTELMVPKAILDQWLDLGITDEQMSEAVAVLNAEYSKRSAGADPEATTPPGAGDESPSTTSSTGGD